MKTLAAYLLIAAGAAHAADYSTIIAIGVGLAESEQVFIPTKIDRIAATTRPVASAGDESSPPPASYNPAPPPIYTPTPPYPSRSVSGSRWLENGAVPTVDHLLTGEHAGLFTIEFLLALTPEQRVALHSDAHENKIQWGYIADNPVVVSKPAVVSSKAVVTRAARRVILTAPPPAMDWAECPNCNRPGSGRVFTRRW